MDDDPFTELLNMAAGTNLEAAAKGQASLEQKILNLRAKAVIAGVGDMKDFLEAQKKLEGEK